MRWFWKFQSKAAIRLARSLKSGYSVAHRLANRIGEQLDSKPEMQYFQHVHVVAFALIHLLYLHLHLLEFDRMSRMLKAKPRGQYSRCGLPERMLSFHPHCKDLILRRITHGVGERSIRDDLPHSSWQLDSGIDLVPAACHSCYTAEIGRAHV